jgi:Mor family transcriptional regulator
MILVCSQAVGAESAQQGIRALCRYFGGQMIYIPVRDKGGVSAQKIHGILAEATTDTVASIMLEKLMFCYGGLQCYIPLERCAFHKTIALEMYRRYDQRALPMNDLARQYNISAHHAYALWKIGRHEKLNPSMPYLPFLELAENQ